MRHASLHPPSRRRHLTRAAVGAGLAGSLALALSMGASLSGFTATITNSENTTATAALAIEETGGGSTCASYDSTATCSTINKYGGTTTPLVPGGSSTTTVTFTNTGSVAVGASTMKGGICTATTRAGVTGATTPSATNTDPGNLCSVLELSVYKASTATGTPIFTGSPAAFQTATATTLGTLAVSGSQDYTFVVRFPSGATTAVQGQQVSQTIAWKFDQ
ncbi:hypothetical protein [uncultured Nocardioides sp.]|uniref:hypothetical protein n=1 Tax=uncultured Nocardioides sp. TaxID=198441 RepID=UPI0026163537|nr:hypothetical protein [uncultured Nocardioides sp.]